METTQGPCGRCSAACMRDGCGPCSHECHNITAEEVLEGRSLICVTCENRWAAARNAKDARAKAGRWVSGARRDHYVIDGRALCGRAEGA